MAYIGMPNSKTDVSKSDFVVWVEKYLRLEGNEQLTGLDVYGARCSMLHCHSVYSNLSRKGKCRLIAYASDMYPPILVNSQIDASLVLVSIPALAAAFFNAIDNSLVDLFSTENHRRKAVVEQRLQTLVHNISTKPKLGDAIED